MSNVLSRKYDYYCLKYCINKVTVHGQYILEDAHKTNKIEDEPFCLFCSFIYLVMQNVENVSMEMEKRVHE